MKGCMPLSVTALELEDPAAYSQQFSCSSVLSSSLISSDRARYLAAAAFAWYCSMLRHVCPCLSQSTCIQTLDRPF